MTEQLPQFLHSHRDAARLAYRQADHEGALTHNRRFLQEAETSGEILGQILGHRYIGLCLYRLNRLEESEESLRLALRLAEEHQETEQALLIHNHLAATLVGLGQLGEAYAMLSNALARAELPRYVHALTRLLGNLGALYDEFGQRERADECYAKFEILTELLGSPHRLANARGLAARSAELRRDFKLAEEKYAQEFELAERSGDRLRQIAALMHRGRMAQHLERYDEADRDFREALIMAQERPYERRLVIACINYAEFLRERGQLVRAHHWLTQAEPRCNRPEQKALVHHALASVLRDANLLGESLWHLQRSVEARDEMYHPLKDAAVQNMAQRRLAELSKFTRELVANAYRVARNEAELAAIERLVDRVDREGAWRHYRQKLEAQEGEPVYKHRADLRRQAEEVWMNLLGGTAELCRETRDMLHRAELSYSSSIDDLGRSSHMFALVIEGELKRRIFEPAQATFTGTGRGNESTTHKEFVDHKEKANGQARKRWTLKDMLKVLAEVASEKATPRENFLSELRGRLMPCMLAVRRVAELNGPFPCCDGSTIDFITLRNEIAHGERIEDLNRIQVDAIKRRIALETPIEHSPTILQALMTLCLAPAPSPS